MSIQYNSQYVDEKYLPILEPNLYTDTVLIPGVTYTDKYVTGPAGQLFVHKLTKGDLIAPKAPGQDFSNVETSDSLIAIALNNNFQSSRKIYGVQENAVDFNLAEENLSTAIAVIRESRQYSALACLAHEGTPTTDNTTINSGDTAVTALLAMRKEIKDAHGQANFCLVNTTVYQYLLSKVGIVVAQDPATRDAELLRRFGLNIIECNSFDSSAKYIDYAGTTRTVALNNVLMIMGYSEAFSIVPNLEAMRLHDSEHFIGTLAQVEMNMGFRVTSPSQVIVKATTASV